ncbi:hypothetical protein [Methylocella silvestris]|uniref:Uncharacterized protein n=1 Tax=Methylocella silvestris TaxID=199596 RepID=A0A2J7TJ30_METSI|nr:hypothetical protein [Methylocella silvestris]PNG26770.1 hypothetical protein CR492_07270 [Methylocella silvestris]
MTLEKLAQIARRLAPLQDFKWLAQLAGDLKADGAPAKHKPAVDASELLIAGLSLVAQYVVAGAPMNLPAAINIRDGFMVALLASCPIRAKTLIGLPLEARCDSREDAGGSTCRAARQRTGAPTAEWSRFFSISRSTLICGACARFF